MNLAARLIVTLIAEENELFDKVLIVGKSERKEGG
jgi:hypothetical protein